MINKSDIALLIDELDLEDSNKLIKELYASPNISISIMKKINDKKPLDVINFYEKLRKSYNAKKSKLYINILKSDEEELEVKKVLTTLSAMLNQILQYNAQDKLLFYKHIRADEISKALELYFKSFDITAAYKLLKMIKADMYVLENVSGKRNDLC